MLDETRSTREWITGYRLDQHSRDGMVSVHVSWPHDWTGWYTDMNEHTPRVGNHCYPCILLEYLEHRRQANVLGEVMYGCNQSGPAIICIPV